jgi:bacteriocin biosynthesis cyclodehydratase domain-containing protein
MAVTSAPAPIRQLRFPKLRPGLPVLQREHGELQIGLDSDTALIFGEPRLRGVFEALDGAHHVRQLREAGRQAGLGVDDVDDALRVLDEARLLCEGGRTLRPADPLQHRSVRLVGAGPLGRSVAKLLSASGLGRLWLVDEEPSEHPSGRRRGLLTRSQALRAMLTDRASLQVDVADHWSKPEHAIPDLTVVASDTVEVDRMVADDLVRADQPHLVVRSTGAAVVVGPLVVPGRTACLHCTDLSRRDADRSWPALLDQLTRLRLPTSPTLGAWAASVTVTQAVAYLRGRTPEAWGSTIELADSDLLTRWRAWSAHPGCGCHWPSATQWRA